MWWGLSCGPVVVVHASLTLGPATTYDRFSVTPDSLRIRGWGTGSTYDGCADWLAVVYDLDAAGYQATLERWKVLHRRRRNLWQALRAKRLPLGDV